MPRVGWETWLLGPAWHPKPRPEYPLDRMGCCWLVAMASFSLQQLSCPPGQRLGLEGEGGLCGPLPAPPERQDPAILWVRQPGVHPQPSGQLAKSSEAHAGVLSGKQMPDCLILGGHHAGSWARAGASSPDRLRAFEGLVEK